MITVHNLDNSRSMRIIWLLEELGLDFELIQYKRNEQDNLAPDDYKRLHPVGKSPIVSDNNEVMIESGAIMETLLERYGQGRLQPAGNSPKWHQYRYWMHASEGSLMPLLVLRLLLNRMDTRAPFIIRPIIKVVTGKVNSFYVEPSLASFMKYTNDELATGPWLLGDTFTAADIMLGFPLHIVDARAGISDSFTHIKAYINRLNARDAFKRAMEKNGPFTPLS